MTFIEIYKGNSLMKHIDIRTKVGAFFLPPVAVFPIGCLTFPKDTAMPQKLIVLNNSHYCLIDLKSSSVKTICAINSNSVGG